MLACCGALAVAAAGSLLYAHAQSAPVPEKTASTPGPAPATAQQPTPPAGSIPDGARKQEITSACADLLKMATDLKREVDKSNANTLSVTVVRKAGAIEQLAHKVRTGSPKG